MGSSKSKKSDPWDEPEKYLPRTGDDDDYDDPEEDSKSDGNRRRDSGYGAAV